MALETIPLKLTPPKLHPKTRPKWPRSMCTDLSTLRNKVKHARHSTTFSTKHAPPPSRALRQPSFTPRLARPRGMPARPPGGTTTGPTTLLPNLPAMLPSTPNNDETPYKRGGLARHPELNTHAHTPLRQKPRALLSKYSGNGEKMQRALPRPPSPPFATTRAIF